VVWLDIVFDPICPWCFIGKAQLERALGGVPNPPFALRWQPFQLNPHMPPQGMERALYLERKFGGKDKAARAYKDIAAHAQKAKVPINFAGILRTPNTLNAHRLVHWAAIEGQATAMAEALFQAYFTRGRDIGDSDVLVLLAQEVGLDGTVVRRLLRSDADADLLRAREAHFRTMGVHSVPTFILDNHYVIAGAQPVALWQDVLAELHQQATQG